MSNVVGLVKSRLRSRSRRGKSVDGVDVVISDGGHLVRFTSLRQQALGEPTEEDFFVSPARPNEPSRPSNETEPSSDHSCSLQHSISVPPLPATTPPSERSFPRRQSSLDNPRAYQIHAHRRASSQGKDLDQGPPVPRHRRHYTISASQTWPVYDGGDKCLQSSAAKPGPIYATRTCGSIAENPYQMSRGLRDDESRLHSSRMRRNTVNGARVTPSGTPLYPRLGANEDGHSFASPRHLNHNVPLPLFSEEKAASTMVVTERISLTPEPGPVPAGRTSIETVWHPAVEQQIPEREQPNVSHSPTKRNTHGNDYAHSLDVVSSPTTAPKLYKLDEKTGQMVEIDSLASWTMPQSSPIRHPDVSDLGHFQRHGVVTNSYRYALTAHSPGREETTWI